MKRRNRLAGQRQPDGQSAMKSAACDIAVSEMIGWPAEEICGYIMLVMKHRPDGTHELAIMPSDQKWPWVLKWLERATEDVRGTL